MNLTVNLHSKDGTYINTIVAASIEFVEQYAQENDCTWSLPSPQMVEVSERPLTFEQRISDLEAILAVNGLKDMPAEGALHSAYLTGDMSRATLARFVDNGIIDQDTLETWAAERGATHDH